jgi:fructose-1-phosphate kinase PfkB-like protein
MNMYRLNVVKKSTVGAGDSMVGGWFGHFKNKSLKEVIRWELFVVLRQL